MPKSIYEDIFHDLKQKIEAGKFEGILPSENELIQIYHCSRNTIRRAISMLSEIGYTQSIHGKGVHIIYSSMAFTPKYYDLGSITGLSQSGENHGFKVVNNVITFSEIKVDEMLSKKTGLEKESEVYFFERLRYVDGIAKMLDFTFIRKDIVPDLNEDILKGSLFQHIEESGTTIQTVKRNVTIEKTTKQDEKYLDLDGYNSLAIITSYVYNDKGIQIEFTESRNRPDLFAFQTIATRNS